MITRDLDLYHRPVVVDMLHAKSVDGLDKRQLPPRQIVDKRSVQRSRQQLFFVFHEHIPDPEDQQIDELGPQELHLLVVVIDVIEYLFYPATRIIPRLLIEERK